MPLTPAQKRAHDNYRRNHRKVNYSQLLIRKCDKERIDIIADKLGYSITRAMTVMLDIVERQFGV